MLDLLLSTLASSLNQVCLVSMSHGEVIGTRQGARFSVSSPAVVNTDRLSFPVPRGAEVAGVALFNDGELMRVLPLPFVRFQRAGRYVIEAGEVRLEFEEVS